MLLLLLWLLLLLLNDNVHYLPSKFVDIDDCANQPCKNSATCKDGVNSYSCVCQSGFTGEHCENGEFFAHV